MAGDVLTEAELEAVLADASVPIRFQRIAFALRAERERSRKLADLLRSARHYSGPDPVLWDMIEKALREYQEASGD